MMAIAPTPGPRGTSIRRLLVALLTVCAGTLALAPGATAAGSKQPQAAPSSPSAAKTSTPIKHFVSVMQEGHSFDNYFGTYPRAYTRNANACLPVTAAEMGDRPRCVKPARVTGRSITDLPHTEDTFAAQYAQGRMTGFATAFSQPQLGSQSLGYYDRSDLRFLHTVADQYVLFDMYFASAKGGSGPNHFFWTTGTSGQQSGPVTTIFDRLDAAGISWKFYVQNFDSTLAWRTDASSMRREALLTRVPLLRYSRFRHPGMRSGVVPVTEYFEDLRRGTLPAVSFIVPGSSSERAPAGPDNTRFSRSLLTALMVSSAWRDSAFVVAYDSWGGWYDHLPPPQVDADGYGFRVPALLVSPFAPRGTVIHSVLDHTSQLKFIEDNWLVRPLSVRDARAQSVAVGLDFRATPRRPAIIGTSNAAPAVARPRSGVVYLGYGCAVAATCAVIGFIGVWSRRTPPSKGSP